MTLHGVDATELLALHLVTRRTQEGPIRFNLNLNLKDGTDPGVSVASCDPVAVLRLSEFFAGVDTDRVIEISLPTTRISCPVSVAADPAFADLRNLLRDLVMVRDELGLNLPIPDVWAAQDQRVIRFAAQLLRDEHTPFPWLIRPTSHRSAEEHLHDVRPTSPRGVSLWTSIDNLPPTFNGQEFEIGQVWLHFDSVDLQDPEGCEAAARAGHDADRVFVPQPGTRRARPPPRPSTAAPFPTSRGSCCRACPGRAEQIQHHLVQSGEHVRVQRSSVPRGVMASR
ncbi:hypothetical protein SK854_05645 [Lentzea sp. BCCO 10_0061]|uniref:Uncharacterized protein n=1 Tax=Lentzea sokolovensis TaxID=3095429 RepID=A0ABU4US05_9PSEU|nr:hypothetical protein [Lentzea sp. BCCO 10_0061]MDX8141586.1 hypothetical protein [Lentzea sp. BCCO 10_0061]